MKNNLIVTIGAIVAVVVLVGLAFAMYISITNTEIRKYKHYEAKQKDIENVYDEVWVTISQKADISKDYRDSFKDIYTHIMSERYEKGDGTLMKWIKESNPNFETTLYLDLAQTIESKRGEFKNAQTELLDVVRDYNTYISVFPNRLFLSKQEIKPQLISTSRTQEAIRTGIDDNVKLFND